MKLKIFLTSVCLFISAQSFAASGLSLDNLSATNFKKISEEFSANFVHTSVSSASPLGAILGFEVGVIGSMTSSPELEALSKTANPSGTALGSLPYAGLFASVSVPFALTFELSYLPETKLSSITLDSFGAGVKWTFDKFIFDIPLVDIAVKGHYSSANLSFSQTLSSVDSTLKLSDSMYGIAVIASANILIFEPFVSIGYVSAKTDLTTSLSSSSLFSFTSANTSSQDLSSMQIIAGAQLNLFFMRFAVEMMRVFDTNRYSAKLTFGF